MRVDACTTGGFKEFRTLSPFWEGVLKVITIPLGCAVLQYSVPNVREPDMISRTRLHTTKLHVQ